MTSLALNRSLSGNQLFAEKLKDASRKSQFPSQPPAQTPTLLRVWQWLQAKFQARAAAKPLELTGTLALGEKRTIFIVQVSGRKFLVGGTPNNLTMLADLGPVDGSAEAPIVPAIQPQVKKERRRTAAALPAGSASYKAALPLAANSVASPRRSRRKAEVVREEIAIW